MTTPSNEVSALIDHIDEFLNAECVEVDNDGAVQFFEDLEPIVAAIRQQAAVQALREASEAYPLETAYGGAEHAVLWLKERATEIEEES